MPFASGRVLWRLVALGSPHSHAQLHNIRVAFRAGFADAWGTPLDVRCPTGTGAARRARLRKIIIADDGASPQHIAELREVSDHLQQDAPPPIDTAVTASSRSYRGSTAENDMATCRVLPADPHTSVAPDT